MSVHRVLTWLCERPQGDLTLEWDHAGLSHAEIRRDPSTA